MKFAKVNGELPKSKEVRKAIFEVEAERVGNKTEFKIQQTKELGTSQRKEICKPYHSWLVDLFWIAGLAVSNTIAERNAARVSYK